MHDQHRFLGIDRFRDPGLAPQMEDAGEVGSILEPRDQVVGGSAGVLVEHGDPDIGHVVGRGIGEDEELDQRRHHQHEPALLVAPDRQQFLDDQGDQAGPHIGQSSRLRVRTEVAARNTKAISVMAPRSGRITDQMSPARNTVWSVETK